MRLRLTLVQAIFLKKWKLRRAGAASDTTAPSVSTFTVTTPAIGTTITVTSFTASETGASFLITESDTPPLSGAEGWSETAPTEYTVNGATTIYPWVKDSSGNVSAIYDSPVAVEVYETPAYSPNGIEDRQAVVTITTGGGTLWASGNANNLIDGVMSGVAWFGDHAENGLYIRIKFPVKVIISAFKIFQDTPSNNGTWRVQTSDDESTFTDRGSPFTWIGAAGGVEVAEPSGNTTPYYVYQLIKTGGATNPDAYQVELQWKVGYPI